MLAALSYLWAVDMGLGMKSAAILALTASVALAGCAGFGTSRDSIVKGETPVCEDVTVQVYFEPDSAELTNEGSAVLNAAADKAKACKVDRVRVLGLADAVGAPAANMELSRKRTAAVTRALIAAGLPDAEFDLAAAGQAGAVTADGEDRPVRRRADVTLELSAR